MYYQNLGLVLLVFLGVVALGRSHDQCNKCDFDVFVVGMGWAGVGALYELQNYNNFAPKRRRLKFGGADRAEYVGGRAIAARVVSGRKGNPIYAFMKDLFTRKKKNKLKENYLRWTTVDWSNYTAFNKNGNELLPRKVRLTQRKFDNAFDCLYGKAEAGVYSPSDTTRDVLIECGWEPKPNGGDFANVLEHWDFDLELLFPNDKTSILNFPLYTYTDWQSKDVFIPLEGKDGKPSNAAGIADRVAREYIDEFENEDIIMFHTTVTNIKWDVDGCVVLTVETAKEGAITSRTFTAGNVIFTGSAGVLNAFGDNKYDTDAIFDPVLPEPKMTALRKTFFLEKEPETYRRTMSTYKELIVQLGPGVNLSKDPNSNFLFIETEGWNIETESGKRGHCNIWQSVDRGPDEFFNGSRTYICELGVSVVNEDPFSDDIGDTDNVFTEAELKDIIDATLGKILELPNNCQRVIPPLFLTEPITAVDDQCLFQIFDGSGPEFGVWEGSWSTFMASDWTIEDYYNKIKAPLVRAHDKKPVVWFGGEHMCLRYNGYINGAYYSGLEQANNVLKAILSERQYKKWARHATDYFCDIGEIPFAASTDDDDDDDDENDDNDDDDDDDDCNHRRGYGNLFRSGNGW